MKELSDFVKIYNIDDPDYDKFVVESIDSIKDQEWSQHQWFSYNGPIERNNKKELSTYYPKSPATKRIWRDYQTAAVTKYIDELKFPTSIYFISDVRYNRYDENTQMLSHHDHIRSLFDGMKKGIPVFTILTAMNPLSDYTGGEFVFEYIDQEIKLEMGQIMVFPSVFLYQHYVKEVMVGKRYTSVSWAF